MVDPVSGILMFCETGRACPMSCSIGVGWSLADCCHPNVPSRRNLKRLVEGISVCIEKDTGCCMDSLKYSMCICT